MKHASRIWSRQHTYGAHAAHTRNHASRSWPCFVPTLRGSARVHNDYRMLCTTVMHAAPARGWFMRPQEDNCPGTMRSASWPCKNIIVVDGLWQQVQLALDLALALALHCTSTAGTGCVAVVAMPCHGLWLCGGCGQARPWPVAVVAVVARPCRGLWRLWRLWPCHAMACGGCGHAMPPLWKNKHHAYSCLCEARSSCWH